MNCLIVKYLPIIFTQTMYKYNIFGCQDDKKNNQNNTIIAINLPPTMQKIDRNVPSIHISKIS